MPPCPPMHKAVTNAALPDERTPLTLVCLGLNHRTAPVAVREQFSVPKTYLPQAVAELMALDSVAECVLLSTCNRTEVYLWTPECGAAVDEVLRHFLGARPDAQTAACFYRYEAQEALTHLACVAAGLDSMVIGETEIFGQLKQAYRTALEAGATHRSANPTFQHVFSIGKKVRSLTQITSGPTSVGAAAVQMAQDILGPLSGANVLVVGAGDVARSTAQSLCSRGAESVFVANRSYDRAVELAHQVGGKVIRFSEWIPYMAQIDIVIVSTAAPVYVVNPDVLEGIQERRDGRPLFFIDLSVPRNVNPDCAGVPGVHVYDIDALQAMAEHTHSARAAEVRKAQSLIDDWVADNAADLLQQPAPSAVRTPAADEKRP